MLSEPTMPATMRPDFWSSLTSAAAACGGDVHGEVMVATWPDRWSLSMTSVAAARASGLSKRSGAVTTTSSWTSP